MKWCMITILCFALSGYAWSELPDMEWIGTPDRIEATPPDDAFMQEYLEEADNIIGTANVNVFVRTNVKPPVFYTAVGWQGPTLPTLEERNALGESVIHVIRFDLTRDWREKYAEILPMATAAICVIDSSIDDFNGPEIQAFVEEVQPSEIVLGWDSANQIDNPDKLAELSTNLKACVEYAKRGDPDVFVWITACAYVNGATNWFAMIDLSQADGIALWNVHTMPVGWRGTRFLRQAFRHVSIYSNKPVVLAGLFGAKTWKIKDEDTIAEYLTNVFPDVYAEAEKAGFSAVWRMVWKK